MKHLQKNIANEAAVDISNMLAEENKRLREAGAELAIAAMRVATEYDGVHRLMLAVSKWANAMADEHGRGDRTTEQEDVAVIDIETKQCPVCDRQWPERSEQGLAVQKRGKCIICIVEAGQNICMDPYEFGA